MVAVFTNGCFDILHAGHVRLLQWARSLGDNLIVAINSDASICHLKGPQRPIIPESERVYMISALRCVDQVITFEEDTPVKLIRQIRPDILVKGPGCLGTKVPGQGLVESWGGRVMIPDWPIDISTSDIIQRIWDLQLEIEIDRPKLYDILGILRKTNNE